MSLAKIIAAHDDAALEGLTSIGILRRGHRDVDKQKGKVIAVDSKQAEVLADGQTVEIDARGPTAATCTCPAAGVCRHIVLAVLLLRDQQDDRPDSTVLAQDELCALTEAQLRKFAGADWEKAMTLGDSDEAHEIAEEGSSLVVTFPGFEASITFIAGQGLRQAAYKGPKTRQRLLTTVAAMTVREQAGVKAPDEAGAGRVARPKVSAGFLDDAQLTIQRAVAAVIPGRSRIAFDLLLDLAISTRAEALPRLSAEARGLANLARLAQSRDVAFDMETFLRLAARTYALCEGLRTAGDDVALAGTIKRDYQPRDNLDLWLLGAAKWRSSAGARGVTCYGFALDENRWFTVSDGRTAGADPTFSPESVYFNSLWGANEMNKLIGHRITLSGPSAAADGSLSLRAFSAPAKTQERVATRTLLESAAAFEDWGALREHLVTSLGYGLRRRVSPIPVVLVPRKFGGYGFNDLDQTYELEVLDANREKLILSISGDEHDTARHMKQYARKIKAVLVEVTIAEGGVQYRPITAIFDDKHSVACINTDFDAWPRRLTTAAIDRIGSLLGGSREPDARAIDPLETLATDVMEALVGKVGRSSMVDLDQLRSRTETAGLTSLAEALARVQSTDDVESALKAAYITSEIETGLTTAF